MGLIKKLWGLMALLFCLLLLSSCAEAGAGVPIGERKVLLRWEAVDAAARAKIVADLEEDGEVRRYEIQTVRVPSKLKVPEGELSMEAIAPSGLRYGLTIPIHVSVSVDGEPYCQVACYYKIKVYDKVVVATRNLQPRHILQAKDVKLEEREIGLNASRYLTDLESVIGRELSRLVREGLIFTAGMVKNPVIMPMGTVVTIVSRYNGIEIRVEGKAMQAGREGSVIKVQNTATHKVLDARVIDATTVEVIRNH